jgi:xanthine dehydrogenase YagT iron-sulfur-binding subunit
MRRSRSVVPWLTVSLLPGCSDDASQDDAQSAVVRLRINGEEREITVDNRTSLLDMLRERAELPGTKKGCDQGACGACTILLDGARVSSCLTLAVMHEGADIVTIEGLERKGRLHPLQQAFIDHDGFQVRLLHFGTDHVGYRLYQRGPHRISRGDP